jgi:hypothetical protein
MNEYFGMGTEYSVNEPLCLGYEEIQRISGASYAFN